MAAHDNDPFAAERGTYVNNQGVVDGDEHPWPYPSEYSSNSPIFTYTAPVLPRIPELLPLPEWALLAPVDPVIRYPELPPFIKDWPEFLKALQTVSPSDGEVLIINSDIMQASTASIEPKGSLAESTGYRIENISNQWNIFVLTSAPTLATNTNAFIESLVAVSGDTTFGNDDIVIALRKTNGDKNIESSPFAVRSFNGSTVSNAAQNIMIDHKATQAKNIKINGIEDRDINLSKAISSSLPKGSTLLSISQPANGKIINTSADSISEITYQPDINYNGFDSLMIRYSAMGEQNYAKVEFRLKGINDAPVATDNHITFDAPRTRTIEFNVIQCVV